MKRFSTRHGPNQNIAFLGLLCAIVGVVALLSEFVPFSSLFIVLFLPALAAFAIEYSERPYSFLFVLASLALSLGLSASSFQQTLFYIYPAICSGSLYGALRKYGLSTAITIFACSLLALALNYLAIPMVKLFYEIDMIDSILKITGLSLKENIHWIIPSLIYVYSLLQLFISFIITEIINARFEFEPQSIKGKAISIYPCISFLFCLISLVLAFFYEPLAYLLLIMGFYWWFFALANSLSGRHPFLYGTIVVSFLVSFFLFAFFYKSMAKGTGLLLLNVLPLSTSTPIFFLLRQGKENPVVR